MRSWASALVVDDLAGLTGGCLGGGDDLLAGAGPTDGGRIDPECGEVEFVDRLVLGRHDPLERRVAGLDDAGGDRDDTGQAALDHVVAVLSLALHRGGVARNLDRLGERDRRQVE